MARGPAQHAEPLTQKYQPACKPGSGGHRLACARTIRDGHSSGAMFAHGLEQPTRTVEPDTALRRYRLAANGPRCRPYSVLLPVGFTMPFPLPDPRCALTAPFHPYRAEAPRGEGGRFVLCGTFPGVAPAGRYPAPYVDGARTFLSCGLSALAGAAVRPTDGSRHGGCGARRQAISPARRRKIIYPDNVVCGVGRSTGCRRSSRSRGVTKCSICC